MIDLNSSSRIIISTQAQAINSFWINERLLEKKIKKQLKENLVLLKESVGSRTYSAHVWHNTNLIIRSFEPRGLAAYPGSQTFALIEL